MSVWMDQERAASVARVISRKLKAAGFNVAKRLPRKISNGRSIHSHSEGLVVHRIGYGSKVAVYYNSHGYNTVLMPEQKQHLAGALEFLRGQGYAFDDRFWLETKEERKRA